VRPDDELRLQSEVLEVRVSKSRPTQGLIKVRTTTLNQRDEAVQVFVGNLLVPCRPKSPRLGAEADESYLLPSTSQATS
jgi:acyl dehydratase